MSTLFDPIKAAGKAGWVRRHPMAGDFEALDETALYVNTANHTATITFAGGQALLDITRADNTINSNIQLRLASAAKYRARFPVDAGDMLFVSFDYASEFAAPLRTAYARARWILAKASAPYTAVNPPSSTSKTPKLFLDDRPVGSPWVHVEYLFKAVATVYPDVGINFQLGGKVGKWWFDNIQVWQKRV